MKRVVKKPEVRRQEIVTASRKLFLKQGYENTTMHDVMEKLKIAKGTTYHYFKSKEELLEAVVQDIVDQYITKVKKALLECSGDALQKMKVLVQAGRVVPHKIVSMDKLHTPGNMGLHVRLLAETLSKLAPLYAEVIDQGCKEGLFQVENPLECAEFFLAGIQFVTDMGFYPWNEKDFHRRNQAIPAFLEKELSAPKGSFSFLLDEKNGGV
jgi:AcrR family transcriptional regulator